MKKRILSIILALCIVMSGMTCVSAANITDNELDAMKDFVSYLNIMKGDPDGNFRLYDNITRAEFSKVSVAASKYRDYVAHNAYISPFKDVKFSHWAAPYVKVALDNRIVTGYEDGTFRPDNKVTYEEVITVYMRLLGYTDEEFGVSWPYGQVATAKDIGLCDHVEVIIGEAITRKDVLVLTYNLLSTYVKGTNTDYISILNHTIIEDVILLDTKVSQASGKSDEVVTSAGVYEVGENFDFSDMGYEGDICVDTKTNKIIDFVPNDGILEKHLVYNTLASEVVTYKDGVMGNIKLDGVTKVFDDETVSSLGGIMSKMEMGDVLYIKYDKNSNIDYIIYKSGTLEGPITVSNNDWYTSLGINPDTANITKNGEKVTADKIVKDDIIYCSPELSVVMAYSRKITGVYEKALPNKDMPTSVTVSGITYTLEGINAFNALSSIGEIKYGDTITLLMGKNGAIADAKKIGDGAGNIYYMIAKSDDLEGPITVNGNEWYISRGIEPSKVSVTKNGEKVDFSEIETYDIVYYSAEYDAILAYSNKVTGVYEKATPNKDMPQTVTVSGVVYEIEDVTAFNALSSGGSISYGDTVTLFIGKDGKVADAMKAEEVQTNKNIVGYLMSTGQKKYSDENNHEFVSYYVEVLLPDGTKTEYKTLKDYKNDIGEICFITFKDTNAELKIRATGVNASGKVNSSKKTIGRYSVAADAEIIDLSVYNSQNNEPFSFAKVYLQRLDGITIPEYKILYAGCNSKGELDTLILDDVTGDAHKYGLVSKVTTDKSGTKTYTCMMNNTTVTKTIKGGYLPVSGEGAKILINDNGSVFSIKGLSKIASTDIVSINMSSVVDGKGITYTFAGDVQVYRINPVAGQIYGTYTKIPLSEIADMTKDQEVTAYYDKLDSNGGRVRIITVK